MSRVINDIKLIRYSVSLVFPCAIAMWRGLHFKIQHPSKIVVFNCSEVNIILLKSCNKRGVWNKALSAF